MKTATLTMSLSGGLTDDAIRLAAQGLDVRFQYPEKSNRNPVVHYDPDQDHEIRRSKHRRSHKPIRPKERKLEDRAHELAERAEKNGLDVMVIEGLHAGQFITSKQAQENGLNVIPVNPSNIYNFLSQEKQKEIKSVQETIDDDTSNASDMNRIFITSDARENRENTTTSDFTVPIPRETLRDNSKVMGFHISGYEIPNVRYAIEPTDTRIPVRFGRSAGPNSRKLGIGLCVDNTEDEYPVPRSSPSGIPATATAELPISNNPITGVRPLLVGSKRALRITTAFRIASSPDILAKHWESTDSLGMDGSTLFSFASLTGVPGEGGTDRVSISASSIRCFNARTGPPYWDVGVENTSYSSSLPWLPENDPLLVYEGSYEASESYFSMIPNDVYDVSNPPPRTVSSSSAPSSPREIWIIDEKLYETFFSATLEPSNELVPEYIAGPDRGGLPLGLLYSEPYPSVETLSEALRIALGYIIHPKGMSVAIIPNLEQTLQTRISVNWTLSMKNRLDDMMYNGKLYVSQLKEADLTCPIHGIFSDKLGPYQLKVPEVLIATEELISGNTFEFLSSGPPHIDPNHTASVEVGPVPDPSTGRALVQMAFDGSFFAPPTMDESDTIHSGNSTFKIFFDAHEGTKGKVEQEIQIPVGRYTPALLANTVEHHMRKKSPAMDFRVRALMPEAGTMKFGGLVFFARTRFDLRFDKHGVEENKAVCIPPFMVGYEERKYSGRSQYFPVHANQDPSRNRTTPLCDVGNGYLEAWPSRVTVDGYGRTPKFVFKSEALGASSECIVEKIYPMENTVVLKTPSVLSLPAFSEVGVIPQSLSVDQSVLSSEIESAISGSLSRYKSWTTELEEGEHESIVSSNLSGIIGSLQKIQTILNRYNSSEDSYALEGKTEEQTMEEAISEYIQIGRYLVSLDAMLRKVDSNKDPAPKLTQDDPNLDTNNTLPIQEISLRVKQGRLLVLSMYTVLSHMVGRTVPIYTKPSSLPPDGSGSLEPNSFPVGVSRGYANVVHFHDSVTDHEVTDPSFFEDHARTMAIMLTTPETLISHDDEGMELHVQQSSAMEESLGIATTHILIENMGSSVIVEPTPPHTMELDMASACPSRIQSRFLGLNPFHYVASGDTSIVSEKQISFTYPNAVMLMIELNPSSGSPTRDVVEKRMRESREGFNINNSGTISVVSTGDNPPLYPRVTRCSVYVPLTSEGIVRGEDRVSRMFSSPVCLNSVRVVVLQPDGGYYPLHGETCSVNLNLITV